VLHLYLELRNGSRQTPQEIAEMVHGELGKIDKPYSELETCVGLKPLEVTIIPHGGFMRYMLKQQAKGVELGRMKVCHLNPSDEVVNFLLAPPAREEEPARK
jgi:hypothetical protein